MALFGKSGVGKTTLLRNIVATDLFAGEGLTVIDPHGGLIEELLTLIPRSRTNQVIYFDPRDRHFVPGLNLLESVSPWQRPLVVSALVSAIRNIWPDSWGPRSEYILSHAAFALLEQPHPVTLLSIPRFLTDHAYREKLARHVHDPSVRAFIREYEEWPASFRHEAIAPVLNKLTKFSTNPLLRAIIGQPTSSFSFRWLMDTRKVLLVNLSKGALGEDVSSLLGSLLVTKLALAALSREDIPEAQRRLHLVFVDEVQNFLHGMDFPTILSEARKYRLALTVATQTLAQLPLPTQRAILGNCATLGSFRVSGEDALTLQTEFAQLIAAPQLQELADHHLFVRTLLEGNPMRPDVLQAYPPFEKTGAEADSAKVIEISRQRFARPRAAVEERLMRFLSSEQEAT
jgi:hypothetical protein